ncbi:MAG: hypothetical protein IKP79_02310, partial [Bacilli bacterium]|nr:hypothetical protein [Bacilli bacterium]
NAELMQKVGNFTGVAAQGVPYIIVGEKVFDGFTAEMYGEDFKTTLKAEYDSKDRYDVFEAMEKAEKDAAKAAKGDTNKIILWDCAFSLVTIAAVGTMIYFNNKKMTELVERKLKVKNYDKVEKQEVKNEVKPKNKKKK